jgi:hypothetical protein
MGTSVGVGCGVSVGAGGGVPVGTSVGGGGSGVLVGATGGGGAWPLQAISTTTLAISNIQRPIHEDVFFTTFFSCEPAPGLSPES